MMKFFDAETCLDIIRDKLEENETLWGYQQKLAEASGCQASYFSKVLAGKALLTADQASNLADFWRLNDGECEFFLTLVDLQRATSISLMTKLQRKLEELRTEGKRLRPAEEAVKKVEVDLSEEDTKFFCQNWFCPAIRNIVRYPSVRSSIRISDHFNLPLGLVEEVLERLRKMKLVDYQNGEWTTTDIIVSRPSYHNANLAYVSKQDRARFKNATGLENNLTMAWVAAMSRRQFEELKILMRNAIAEQIAWSEPDKNEEVLVGTCCDLFLI